MTIIEYLNPSFLLVFLNTLDIEAKLIKIKSLFFYDFGKDIQDFPLLFPHNISHLQRHQTWGS